jgi:uncharacterized coiled-coil DUF342 family protein
VTALPDSLERELRKLLEHIGELKVQLQEVSTKLDERHHLYDERHQKIEGEVSGALDRLVTMERDNAKSSVMVTLITSVTTAALTALALKLFTSG